MLRKYINKKCFKWFSENATKQVIGIDLGTTNTCVAVPDGRTGRIVQNAEGMRTTPSVVAFTKEGEELIGPAAKRQALTNPENTFYATKRLIGRKFDDPSVQKDIKNLSYKIIKHTNGDAWVQTSMGDSYSPSQIGALILNKMRETAENYTNTPISEAVITVPAYFNNSQRQATKYAGKLAGLRVLRIINEPTAACLAYGLDNSENKKLAVFDLGGGTFDISILEMKDDVFEVKATNGDTSCGGEDVDVIITEFLINQFKKESGVDISAEKMSVQRVREVAEKAKIELSTGFRSEINLPYLAADATGPKHFSYTLTRANIEKLCSELLDKTIKPVQNCLKDAGLKKENIDEVLLVGGMTRMPRIQSHVEKLFGKAPIKGVNPDEAVAIGAAIQGGILQGEIEDVYLVDVVPLSLGIEVLGGVFDKVIERNKQLPARKTHLFTTASDNQTQVIINVYQGEREMACDNKFLGQFELLGIPPAPRGVPQIEVEFNVDLNGVLKLNARDKTTSLSKELEIKMPSGFTKYDVEEILEESEEMKEEDKYKKQAAEVKNYLDLHIYKIEKFLEDYMPKLSREDFTSIETIANEANDAIQSEDTEKMYKIKPKIDTAHKIMQKYLDSGNESEDFDEQFEDDLDKKYRKK